MVTPICAGWTKIPLDIMVDEYNKKNLNDNFEN